ncbi:GNAT family N-acetyltransferase [Saccharomonospora sp. NB11]|jgi:ribosomal-protein-alanine N-acetyltransferase|uniref:GNAT family N-acetyltransferase n=1 Tax=Saccharomonospora sp. NB11 TaxID=1642298 RepID=UPI0018D13ECC|nr:GNAT family protein [Saccharomonospora sp. NB11]
MSPGSGVPYVAEPQRPGWPARLGPLVVPAGVVRLRPLRLRDGRDWSRLRLRDRDYLERWEPAQPGGWRERNAVSAWPSQWSGLRRLAKRGECFPFAITVDDEFVGQLTIGNVIRAALRSAWIGYWVSSVHAGGGVATAAVALATDHAFTEGGLHRLEATVRPDNVASLGVLAKAGYRREGLFLRYLLVEGRWRDHLCYAITAEEIGDGVVARLVESGKASRLESR